MRSYKFRDIHRKTHVFETLWWIFQHRIFRSNFFIQQLLYIGCFYTFIYKKLLCIWSCFFSLWLGKNKDSLRAKITKLVIRNIVNVGSWKFQWPLPREKTIKTWFELIFSFIELLLLIKKLQTLVFPKQLVPQSIFVLGGEIISQLIKVENPRTISLLPKTIV